MGKIDNDEVKRVANAIAESVSDLTKRDDSILSVSCGEASDKEKEVINLLSTICTSTFRDMFNNTKSMLDAISDAFKRADRKYAGIPDEDTHKS